jgi:hypothetical protein
LWARDLDRLVLLVEEHASAASARLEASGNGLDCLVGAGFETASFLGLLNRLRRPHQPAEQPATATTGTGMAT